MKNNENKPDKNCTHLAGEYFVAAELYKRGYSIGITMGNAKAIDIFAEKSGKRVNVQVKALRSRKAGGWRIMKDDVVSNVIYVLVCLNEINESPEYFIMSSRVIKRNIIQYKTSGILRYSFVDNVEYRERWDKIESIGQRKNKRRHR